MQGTNSGWEKWKLRNLEGVFDTMSLNRSTLESLMCFERGRRLGRLGAASGRFSAVPWPGQLDDLVRFERVSCRVTSSSARLRVPL